MFLKSLALTLALVFSSAFSFSALGSLKSPIETGDYQVKKGPEDFCLPFKLKELPEKDDVPVYLSPLHSLYLKARTDKATSDINPSCLFKTEVKRKDSGQKTVVTVIESEECKDKVASHITNTFTLKPESIVLDVVEKGGSGYSCEWALVKPKK
jgi:hypothetical protein